MKKTLPFLITYYSDRRIFEFTKLGSPSDQPFVQFFINQSDVEASPEVLQWLIDNAQVSSTHRSKR